MSPYDELIDRVHGPVLARGAAGYDEELEVRADLLTGGLRALPVRWRP